MATVLPRNPGQGVVSPPDPTGLPLSGPLPAPPPVGRRGVAPGAAPAVARLVDRRPRLVLFLFCLVLWIPGFTTLPPGDRDESRFVQATKQMLETGDFVRIMNGAEPRNRKPIGIHWLQVPFVAAAQAMGLATANPVWPYRIPSALGALAAVLAAFALGEGLIGRRAAALGAAMLAASPLLIVEVHIAKTDAALLGATTVAMAVLARAWRVPVAVGPGLAAVFWLVVGLGILLKGPILPMVVGGAVLALVVCERRGAWLSALRPVWGIPLALLVVLPWFIAIGLATEGRFLAEAVGGDLGPKLTTGDDGHGAPPGTHLVLLAVLLFPFTAALPGAIHATWRDRGLVPVRFLLGWIVPAWIVFEAAPTKLPHYTLVLYPAICLLLARAVLAGPAPVWARRSGMALAAVVGAALATLFAAAPFILRMPIGDALATGGPAAIAAIVATGCAIQAVRPAGVAGALAGAMLMAAVAIGWTAPRLVPLWIAPRVVAAVPSLRSGARLGAVGFAEPSLMFLAGTATAWLSAFDAAAALAEGRVDLLAIGDRDLGRVRAALDARGVAVRVIATVPGYNYSRGRPVTLTLVTR